MTALTDSRNRKRLVVVGMGAATCLGRDWPSTWRALERGEGGISRNQDRLPTDRFLTDIGGFVEGYGPSSADEDPRLAKLEARFLHLGPGRETLGGSQRVGGLHLMQQHVHTQDGDRRD